ncbi:MAG TPA: multiheme c-type cytochrome [Verrucomicrobiae bacterium]
MSKLLYRLLLFSLVGQLLPLPAADAPRYLGAPSCASTSCHGGGGAGHDQYLLWSTRDFHSQRPVATLATARSRQIAAGLGMADPQTDTRCTACHAPLTAIAPERQGPHFKVSEGVGCESCHGPAEPWLRPHTRPDFSRADRTATGLRDLQDLYVRAGTCVACHQVVAPALEQAGHPELIFELDGQSATEPRHWSAGKNGNGAQAWLVGQAVALRELSWQLEQLHPQSEADRRLAETNLVERAYALAWVLRQATEDRTVVELFQADFGSVQAWADQLARRESSQPWAADRTKVMLKRLAGLSSSFTDPNITPSLQARRAERLVLALDRLATAAQMRQADAELNRLFQLAQSRPDFDRAAFATALQAAAGALQL